MTAAQTEEQERRGDAKCFHSHSASVQTKGRDDKFRHFHGAPMPRDQLVMTIERGNLPLLRSLVEKGACSVDAVDGRGNNMLHLAVLAGQLEVARYVVKRCRALAEGRNRDGLAPIHLAVQANQHGFVEMLFMAARRLRSQDRLSLLQYAVSHSHPAIVELCLKRCGGSMEAMVNARDASGQTLMHLAASGGCRDMLALLHRLGGQLTLRNDAGMLPFHCAVRSGFMFTAEYIATLGSVDPRRIVNDCLAGTTCLLLACASCFDPRLVERLLGWGADLEARDAEGRTALHHAVRNDAVGEELVAMLLPLMCSNVRDWHGLTPQDTAQQLGKHRVVAVFATRMSGNGFVATDTFLK